jgi:large subunit ribosomal protein L2
MGKRIIARRRGAGSGVYRSPSHKHKAPARLPNFTKGTGEVITIEHAPGRNTPLAAIRLDNGEVAVQIASEGLSVGQTLQYTDEKLNTVEAGTTAYISNIPEGTPIFNIEGTPGDGGRYSRSSGNAAYVVSHTGKHTTVMLPSGKTRSFNPRCRATIGAPAGGGAGDKPFLKAGKKHHKVKTRAYNWPKVRGVAMNPVDHPHGGGSHSYSGGPTSLARGSPPGQKVGKIAPKRSGKK